METLDLRHDGTYSYSIDFAAGGRATDSGRWKMIAQKERLEGAQVILLNAIEACGVFGDRSVPSKRADRNLYTVWEWGRLILSFNPDVQGFTRT